MPRMLRLCFILFFSCPLVLAQEASRCRHGAHPLTSVEIEEIEKVEAILSSSQGASMRQQVDQVYTIPVVVHVVYSNSTQNISIDQVRQQIEVLNKDYRKKNTDTSDTPIGFVPNSADAHIEFRLAARDPNGNPTNGVTRTLTTKAVFSFSSEDVKYTSQGGHDPWDPKSYLNIWVCNLSAGVIGYVPYPLIPGSSTDGAVISYTAFGTSGNLNVKYNLGRTVTHEVGHWFNLLHLWGSPIASGCTSDGVDDTPPQGSETSSNLSCPIYPYKKPEDTCNKDSRGRMWCNFLDYTRDECMSMFSQGQAQRMVSYLTLFRSSILQSKAFLENDLAVSRVYYDNRKNCSQQTESPQITIVNKGIDTAKAFNLWADMNSGTVRYVWAGLLPPGQDTILYLTGLSLQEGENHIRARVELLLPNADQDFANDTSEYSFLCPLSLDVKATLLTNHSQADCSSVPITGTIKISNAGSMDIFQYNYSFSLNDSIIFTKQVDGRLLAGFDTTITELLEGLVNGTNHIQAFIQLLQPGQDQQVLNDTIKTTVSCVSPLSIYPNPADNILYVKGNDPKLKSVTLYSLEGKEVLKAENVAKVDISSLGQGFYLVRLLTEEDNITYQLIVVR